MALKILFTSNKFPQRFKTCIRHLIDGRQLKLFIKSLCNNIGIFQRCKVGDRLATPLSIILHYPILKRFA